MKYVDPVYVRASEPLEFWTITIFLTMGALFFLYWFARNLRNARLIEDTPTSKIRSAAQGFVELEGIAKPLPPGEPLLSPLSQTPCHWYRFNIKRKVRSGKNTTWRTIQSGTSPHPILLDDNTGECLIKPAKASIHTHVSNSWYGTSRHPSPLSISRKESLIQFGNYRYSESLVPLNAPLYAMGDFRTLRSTDQFTKEKAVANIIKEWKSDYDAMVQRFDRNGDGTLDEKEWKLVRLAANLEAEDLQNKLMAEADVHTMEKPKGNYPFLISTEDQLVFTKRLKWHYRISAIALLVFMYGSGWMMIQRFSI